MLIAKVFLPLATPGLAALGAGLLAVTSGAYNAIQICAIVIGLVTVAVAGAFTIRSNVGKIWREQAEGEKARNTDLLSDMAESKVQQAAREAAWVLREAEFVAETHRLQVELEAALKRTDQSPVVSKLDQILTALSPQQVTVTGEDGGPIQVKETP